MAVNVQEAEVEIAPPAPAEGQTRVAKNALIYMASQLGSWLVAFLTVSIIPRRLGEAGMGQLSIAGTAVGSLAFMLMLSIENYITVEVGRNPDDTSLLVRGTLGLRLLLLPVMALVGIVSLSVNHVSPTAWQIGIIFIVSAVVSYMAGPMRSVLAGWEDAKRVAAFDFLASLSPVFTLPFLKYGPVAYALIYFFPSLINAIAMMIFVRRHISLRPIFDLKLFRRLIQGSFGFLVNDWVMPLYGYCTVFILKYYTTEAAVGVYSQAQRLMGTFVFVPTAIGYAMLPSLARLAESNAGEFKRMQDRLLVIMLVLGLPVVAMIAMLAAPFCRLLYGADRFLDLPLTLQASAFNVLPLYVNMILYRFLIAQKRNLQWSLFLGCTVALNAMLCWILVPFTLHHPSVRNGSVGAVLACAIAEVVTTFAAFCFLKSNPLNRETISRMLRALLAAAVMVGVMWATQHLFLLIPAILGTVVFGVLVWKMEAIGREDQAIIASLVQKELRIGKRS